jgi:hypothetical protein
VIAVTISGVTQVSNINIETHIPNELSREVIIIADIREIIIVKVVPIKAKRNEFLSES